MYFSKHYYYLQSHMASENNNTPPPVPDSPFKKFLDGPSKYFGRMGYYDYPCEINFVSIYHALSVNTETNKLLSELLVALNSKGLWTDGMEDVKTVRNMIHFWQRMLEHPGKLFVPDAWKVNCHLQEGLKPEWFAPESGFLESADCISAWIKACHDEYVVEK